jgi:putative ABC transport system permease protein
VVLFDMLDQTMGQNLETFRDALAQHSAFVAVSASNNVPGRTFGRTRVRPEGVSDEDIWIWSALSVSPETLPTLGMEIAQGRNFSRDRSTDSTGVILINEMAARQLGWDEPIHKRIFFGTQDSVGTEVVGVVKDFHFADIHQNIEPVVIFPLNTNPGNVLAARIQPGRIADALAAARQAWQEVYPDYPFTYTFLDEEFNDLYTRDQTTGKIVNIFSMLAILIACLGLFGLASHSTVQRTKEIGVRKVLGASSGLIVRLLVIDFVRWVALANLIAWPLAWYAATQWLNGFAYRVAVDPLLLLLATVIALVVSMLTVLGQSWRAAAMNPARALRYE